MSLIFSHVNPTGVKSSELDQGLHSSQAEVATEGRTVWKQLERKYYEYRNNILSQDGHLTSPLHIMNERLSKAKTTAEAKVTTLHVPSSGSGNLDKVYCVEMLVGDLKGKGQSPRRKLSVQLAAVDILRKLEDEDKIVGLGVLPGLLENPEIFRKLAVLSSEKKLDQPTYAVVRKRPYSETPLFVVECKIGKHTAYGQSDGRFVAKRFAAKKMYELLSGQKVPEDFTLIGGECFRLDDLHHRGLPDVISHWKNRLADNQILEETTVIGEDEKIDNGDMEEKFDLETNLKYKIPDLAELKEYQPVYRRTSVHNCI